MGAGGSRTRRSSRTSDPNSSIQLLQRYKLVFTGHPPRFVSPAAFIGGLGGWEEDFVNRGVRYAAYMRAKERMDYG